jgi:hypothetical protein
MLKNTKKRFAVLLYSTCMSSNSDNPLTVCHFQHYKCVSVQYCQCIRRTTLPVQGGKNPASQHSALTVPLHRDPHAGCVFVCMKVNTRE